MTNGGQADANGAHHVDEVEKNIWRQHFSEMLKQIDDREARDALKYIAAAKDPDDAKRRVLAVRAGSWQAQALVHSAALGGAVAGHAAAKRWDWKVGPVPVISVVGLVGAAVSFLLPSTVGRSALRFGGLGFSIGAFLGAE